MSQLSVLLLTRNRREFVERCIYSLYATTEREQVMIYIWDNASEDDTADYLATLKKWPYFIPMHSKINIGTEARNKLLKIVTTPYVMSIDDDIWLVTKGWLPAMIECFENYPTLAGLNLGGPRDERNQMGVSWGGVDYNSFSEPRFQYENIVEENIPVIDPQGLDSSWIRCGNQAILLSPPHTFSGSCAIWKTDLLRGYSWKSHAGIMSDMNGEWGDYVRAQGCALGIIWGYRLYHAVGPWWHLGHAEKAWRDKCQQAPVIYNRSYVEQWRWFDQAKAWSGWGSGIPDVEEMIS